MKRLLLLRHAKSSWSDPSLADFDRPLAKRGERDAPLMGARLRARRERPSLIVTSPARRALRTAELVSQALGYPREFLQPERGLYLADAAGILAVIAAQEDRISNLLVVAHNPGMTVLANRLLPDLRLDNLPTAGVVALDLDVDAWRAAPDAVGRLAYYDYPKNPELLVIED
ncbi:MAG TPA: histidine phosphatase family protein [Gammaproteobacteria bacterium]